MPLPTRKIGQTDVTAIGYGAMGISVFYGTPKTDEEGMKASIFRPILVKLLRLQYVPCLALLDPRRGVRERLHELGYCGCVWEQRGYHW